MLDSALELAQNSSSLHVLFPAEEELAHFVKRGMLIRRLAEAKSDTKLVVFTATTDPTELRGVLEAGADGIVLKEGGVPELLEGLDAVRRGERFVSPSLG